MADIGAVILAAGAGRRMGRPKALVEWQGEAFLARVARVLDGQADLAAVCVVLGAEADAVKAQVALPPRVQVVVNADWETGGMLSSIQTGLSALLAAGHAGDGLLVWPVDHPAVGAPAVAELLASYLALRPAVAIPAWSGRHGHPVIFAPETYTELASVSGGEGARAVANAHSRLVVAVDDPGVLLGVDRPADLASLDPVPARA